MGTRVHRKNTYAEVHRVEMASNILAQLIGHASHLPPSSLSGLPDKATLMREYKILASNGEVINKVFSTYKPILEKINRDLSEAMKRHQLSEPPKQEQDVLPVALEAC